MSAVASDKIVPISVRTMPSNIEGEAALIGAMLIENDIIASVAATVKPADFYEPLHQRLCQAIFTRHADGKPSNPVLLKPQFEDDESIKLLGGIKYLASLTSDGYGILVADDLAAQIAELAKKRRLAAGLISTLDAIRDGATSYSDARQLATEVIEEEAPATGETFQLLDIDELEAMPPPSWLIRDFLPEDGLAIIYGDPGAGKSFLALDMALRIARGNDWHGAAAKQTGVLYIAGEGARGIGKRITGWRMAHRLQKLSVPFLLLPIAVQVVEDDQRASLLRTIDEAKRRAGFDIGLIVLDTVSRSIAGMDENAQEAMTSFVRACDAIKAHAGGALLGVHHSGKDKDRGMRGSSVLLGAVDTAIRVTKSERIVTMEVEKQKDAEEGKPAYFEMEPFVWASGNAGNPGEEMSTLVPRRTDSGMESAGINPEQIHAAFGIIADAWGDGRPLSHKPQTQADGRFAPRILAGRIGGDADGWALLIMSWLENDCLSFEVFDKSTKQKGLRVLHPL